MSDHASGLANRFKAAMGAEQARQRAAEEALRAAEDAQRAADEAQRAAEAAKHVSAEQQAVAWKQLIDDLAVLAADVGVLSVVRHGDTATITGNGAHNVRFTRATDSVYAEVAGVRTPLEYHDGAWALVIEGERRPFWDEGAVYVLVEGLGLPMPTSGEAEAPAVAAPVATPVPVVVAASTPDVPTVLTPVEDVDVAADAVPAKKVAKSPPGSALKELKPLW